MCVTYPVLDTFSDWSLGGSVSMGPTLIPICVVYLLQYGW